jgi:hypothetical protein
MKLIKALKLLFIQYTTTDITILTISYLSPEAVAVTEITVVSYSDVGDRDDPQTIDRKKHLSQFTILFIRQLHDMFRPQSGHHQVLKPI